uniref:Plexin-B1 n=1 Tax=Pygocentrus nattereri TaxID=42514 RepID=A0AAR2LZS9_PYGNA
MTNCLLLLSLALLLSLSHTHPFSHRLFLHLVKTEWSGHSLFLDGLALLFNSLVWNGNGGGHLALHPDPVSGRVYLGARDRLFQLSSDLVLEFEAETGPVTDSRECLPPISEANCPMARRTSNHNKLLLVDPYRNELISCGSIHQGTCQKRSLENVGTVLFSAERPVDTQYVAANDPDVSTVGLVVLAGGSKQPVLFVGRGYTSSQPPISTRNLATEPLFSYEETAKLAVAGRLSEYDHHFVASFAHRTHVYFLFYRRDLKLPSREYRTYISRVCLDDSAYYSYVEVPLSCRSAAAKNYNLLQAVRVGRSQGDGAEEEEILLGVFSTRLTSSSKPSEESALCMFSLHELDRRINATRDLCYTKEGRTDGHEAAYIEYEVKSNCNTLNAYPCGSDHTPSPMASRLAVEVEPILDSPSARLTAVAVSVRAGHTIAFLGDSKGNLHKVFLGPDGEVEEYAIIPIQPNTPISSELTLDQSEEFLYIMTSTKVKRPVAECHEHLDCQSCLSAHDPYCGWCVLEGRCGQQGKCARGEQADQWLWSFDMEQHCLTVQALTPSNISREESKSISLSIPGLPRLQDGESYSCFFKDSPSPATVTETGVTCPSPDPQRVPTVRPGQDSVTVMLSLRFGDVIVTSREFTFYDCTVVKQLSGSTPCRGCVSSRWGCNWCVQQHMCTYKAVCEQGVIIYNENGSLVSWGSSACPCVEKVQVTLYNCSVGRSDCSRCHTADQKYGCVWCGGAQSSCVHKESCSQHIEKTCPAPVIHFIEPLSGLIEGGTTLTVSGSNLGQKPQDILRSVIVAGVSCKVIPHLYEISSRIVCTTEENGAESSGHVSVEVPGIGFGLSSQTFSYQNPELEAVSPQRGPRAGGTSLTITGRKLLTGRASDISVLLDDVPCRIVLDVQEGSIECITGASNKTGEHRVTVRYGSSERNLHGSGFYYTSDPNITQAMPSKSFLSGGRLIYVAGHNLDVVQEPRIRVTMFPSNSISRRKRGSRRRRRNRGSVINSEVDQGLLWRHRRIIPEPDCPENTLCSVNTSSLLLCRTPAVGPQVIGADIQVEFLLDNLRFDFSSISQSSFTYELNPTLHPLNHHDPSQPFRYKPGSVISVEGENLDLAIFKEEVVALIGEGVCAVKTLTRNHLYCEPPPQQPSPSNSHGRKREGADALPEFTVQMGNLNFSLGRVQYDSLSPSTFPMEAQIGVGVVASLVVLIVVIIVLIYRRKSKQALRDYKKVQIQLENLETSVRDRCKKEFTDLMTEMMDMSSDLVGSGIPFLDYKMYAERIFFPGHRESPLRRDLDVQDCRRATVEQGLVQLSNLLNSKLFLTKFIHTLESQRTFSPRDRAYVASLLTVALHGKLEYFTDILKTLLNDLVEQYVAKNPKLMLRRTETVVEKLLTNWMSICLYAFLRDSAGECLYMLFRAIKHQVDKGPVDAVTGKAKYTLNDNRLLREDLEYRTLTLNVLMQGVGLNETQPVAAKVLDCDTITQVKEKILDQVYKGTSYSHRPHTDSLDLEWRSGVAGHLILSDEDLTSVVQGSWKRLNTLQHYKVPDGATVALVPRHISQRHSLYIFCLYSFSETPMLEDADEGGVRLWHLVKASEEPELPKHRRGSLRERERAKAIPEIYLTRLLSMKGTLQKFVDDLFTVILSTSRPVPLAVKYFFDLLDDQAAHHSITDAETIHIWKTNSLPLRFWINIVKNPQFIFDVQASDNVDAVLSVIAQTFMDSCTIAEHKLGRDSPINKLLYARDIPRYKQMVERYYADIRQTISASDQEMNSALAELSRNYSGELNYLVALHELYKYINKYYDQIITALEEDTTAQKMQLGYRLQQIAAAVENKVTDL